MTRRAFVGGALAGLAWGPGSGTAVAATGAEDPRLASFDRLMRSFLAEHKIPGAALAVSREGRLVYARGFGLADVERKEPVRPRSLFRIASVSKPFTAAAVLLLVERGRLGLDDRVFELLDVRFDGVKVPAKDGRLRRVTIRQVLQHRGGWDRDRSFDPMFRSTAIARAMRRPPPAGPGLIVPYMWQRPLDYDPGTRYVYSNFGYCVLGRVIEKVAGRPYEAYVRDQLLAPLGIRDMRIGRTLPGGRAPGEVRYVTKGKDRTAPAVLGPRFGRPVPWPYGGWYLEAMDAHGGWIASAPDLVRFADAFATPARRPVLVERSLRAMFAPPDGPAGHRRDGRPKSSYYGCGWQVGHFGPKGAVTFWHSGLLDGTSSLLVHRHDRTTWAALFNTSVAGKGKSPGELIDPLLHAAADKVKHWPEEDLSGKMTG